MNLELHMPEDMDLPEPAHEMAAVTLQPQGHEARVPRDGTGDVAQLLGGSLLLLTIVGVAAHKMPRSTQR